MIDSNCSTVFVGDAVQWPQGDCEYADDAASTPAWRLTSTHETPQFTGGSFDDVTVNQHPSAVLNFVPRKTGAYEVQMALDTMNYDEPDNSGRSLKDGYTTLFANHKRYAGDSEYSLADFLVVRVSVMPMQLDLLGGSESRIVLGSSAVWDGAVHFLEVNLVRTPGFDHCTPTEWFPDNAPSLYYGPRCENPCEVDKYDHRFIYPPTRTEFVVFRGEGIVSPKMTFGADEYVDVVIPIAAMYRSYPWAHKPSNGWESVEHINVYFGIESLGPARAWVNFRDFDLQR